MSHRAALRDLAHASHGVVTVRAAEESGVPAVEVRKLAARGALEHLGYGVYRMTEAAHGPLDEFAEAVALAGNGAVLADEAVLAAHDLAQVNLRQISVATQRRSRRTVPSTVRMVQRKVDETDRDDIDGIPAMSVVAALREVRGRLLPERVSEATKAAAARGLISAADAQQILREFEVSRA